MRFERLTEGGRRRILRMASRGDLIGQEALLGRAYSDDAVACTTVELCRIPASLEIGDMLDVTLETSSRQISQLRREGILEQLDARQARIFLPALQAALQAEDA